MSKNSVEKVAIVGASGNSGRFMVDALLKTGKHIVTAITRADSKSQFPDGVQIKRISYDDQSSIVEALRGQDALIVTMNVMAPKDQEPKLMEAAAAANVPFVFPNEWSPDTADESLSNDIFIGEEKRNVRSLVEKLGKSSWIGMSTGFWYEWSLAIPIAYGFDFANRFVIFFDDGDRPICNSTWPQVGRAVASILSLKIHPDGANDTSPCLDQFKNKFVYVGSFTVSQKDMLDSVMRVTQTSISDWKITKESVHDRYAAGVEEMKGGGRQGFAKALYARVFYPDGSGNTEKTRGLSNHLLGLPQEDIDEATKIAIERSKTDPWNG